jgi:hypothetical protein
MVAAWTLMSAESFDIAFDGKRLFTKLRERSDFCPDNFGIRWASLVITCNCGGKIYVGAPHPRDQIIPTRLRGRATMSSTRHLSQFSVPQWDFETTSAWHSCDARVHDWKHFSSSHNTAKQRRFFSRMEHQTFDENLKLTEVFNSCRIWGLLFYEYFFTYHCVWFLVR